VHRCTTFIDTGKLPLASLDQVNPWQRFDHLAEVLAVGFRVNLVDFGLFPGNVQDLD